MTYLRSMRIAGSRYTMEKHKEQGLAALVADAQQ